MAIASLLAVTLAVAVVRISPAAYAGSGTNYVVYIGAALANSQNSGQQPAVIAVSTSNLGARAGTIGIKEQGAFAAYNVAITPSAGEVYAIGEGDGSASVEKAAIPAGSYVPPAGAVTTEVSPFTQSEAGLAISPDGKFTYTAGRGGLQQLNTSTNSSTTFPYPINGVLNITSVAVSTDSKTVYVGGGLIDTQTSEDTPLLFAFDIATGVSSAWYANNKEIGAEITAIAVSPSGGQIWATLSAPRGPQVLRLSPPAGPGRAFPAGVLIVPAANTLPTAIAVSPDGNTVYLATVSFNNVTNVALFRLDATAQNSTPSSITLPTGEGQALGGQGINSIAVTPDNHTLLATSDLSSSDTGGTLLSASIPVPTNSANSPVVEHSPAPGGSSYYGLAVTPDQAPVARVGVSSAVVTAGGNVTFDAGPSTVAFGNITGYDWSVSGGTCNSLTTATITCHFAAPGSYTAQVTETDSAGNSTVASVLPSGGVVFTGSTASLVPSNFARSAPVTITVTAVVTTTTTTTVKSTTTTTTHSTTTTTSTTVAPTTTTTTTTTVPKVTSHAKLTVNPGIGPPGFVTQVNGVGFPPHRALTVTWSMGVGSVNVTSSATGTFSVQMLVMAEDAPGNRNAQVTGFPTAKAPFLVVPGSLQPGGDDFSLVYDR